MKPASSSAIRIAARTIVGGVALASAISMANFTATAQSTEHWVGTWATSETARPQLPLMPVPQPPPFMPSQCPPPPAPAVPPVQPAPGQVFAPPPFVHFTNQTLRQIVHTSIGGSKARIVLTNALGVVPLVVGAAYIAIRDQQAAIQPASGHALTFGGRPSVTIPPGAVIFSDSFAFNIPEMTDLAIDVYLPGTTNTPSPLSMHPAALQTSYVSETGNHAGTPVFPVVATVQNWFVLARVDVVAPDAVGGLVAFGDSITDGARSTPNTNHRWPDLLMRRLTSAGSRKLGIMNAGIGGNRVLTDGAGTNALARFDLNALSYPGVTHVIVLEGINDIGQARQNPTPTAADLIAGHMQLVERAHAKGVRIYGATLTPFYGAPYYTEVGEAKREALNDWIRTGKAYDAVIDFDKATRDPNNPKMFLPAYDSCDHLHPNDAGYQAMADAIDLALFTPSSATMRSAVR